MGFESNSEEQIPETQSPTASLSVGGIVGGIKSLLVELFDKVSHDEIDHVIALSKFNALDAYKYLLEKYPPPQPVVSQTTAQNVMPVSNQNIPISHQTLTGQAIPQLIQHQFPNVGFDPMMLNQQQQLNNFNYQNPYGIPSQIPSQQINQQQSLYLMNDGMGNSYYVAVNPSQMSNSINSNPMMTSGMTNTSTTTSIPSQPSVSTSASTQTATPSTSTANPSTQPATTHVPITKKKKCKDWDKCTQTSDQTHVEKYFHPCRNGAQCKNIENAVHQNRFIHPCKDGKQCKKKDELHLAMFTHK